MITINMPYLFDSILKVFGKLKVSVEVHDLKTAVNKLNFYAWCFNNFIIY